MWVEGAGAGYALEFEPRLEARPDTLNEQLKGVLPSLSKWRLEEVSKIVHQVYISRYKRRSKPKYGSISKCPTQQQLEAFMRAVNTPKFRLLFGGIMAQLGLRIGEAVRVNIANLDLENRTLTLRSEKSHRLDTVLIPLPLFRETIEFIKTNARAIEESGGYLFFADKKKSHGRLEGFLDENYVRNRFRRYMEKAGLDAVYDVSDEQGGRTPRKLRVFSSHSLRHYAITRFAKGCNGNVLLASKFARHASPETTSIYLHVERSEINAVVDSLALDEVNLLKQRVER